MQDIQRLAADMDMVDIAHPASRANRRAKAPIAIELAQGLGMDPRPFVVAVMFSATLAFATPIGYQTNMMVYGPGGYRFTDFTRIGLPLNLITWVLVSLLIPVLWPLTP
jgi:di/tricarboxylate transporter